MVAVAEEVTFELSAPQGSVFESDRRFRVLIAGRRFGKTHLAAVDQTALALEEPGLYWYTAPTFVNARKFAWPVYKKVTRPWWAKKPNETLLYITLVTGSEIWLVGRENPDNLRGGGIRRMVNDEFAANEKGDKGKATWDAVLRPMLADTMGDALFISTPRGFNWGYTLYEWGQNDPDYPEWQSWQYTTLDGGRVPLEVIEADRRDMDPLTFEQEYEAKFTTKAGRVYYQYEPQVHDDSNVEDAGGELLIGQDFNVEPMASVMAQRVGDQCHILDSMELGASNTNEVCEEVRRRFVEGECDWLKKKRKPEQIVFNPDPTAKRRQTSAPVGQTDYTIIKSYGFRIRAPSTSPLVVDRENNTNAMLKSADGTVRIRIHPRAKALKRGLHGLLYKEGTKQRDKSSPHSHVCDANDYMLWQEFNLLQSRKAVVRRFAV